MDITNEEKAELLIIVSDRCGYDFTGYSDASMTSRIIGFAGLNNIETCFDLQRHLETDDDLLASFILAITVNVTEMFRDPTFFKSLVANVFPSLMAYPNRKIWHAGCSTGEEAYSLAILLQENNMLNDISIHGTDINTKVLAHAHGGNYPMKCMDEYSKNYMKAGGSNSLFDYCAAGMDSVTIDKLIQENIVFSTHNLSGDPPIDQFQLILCRNVLIYFNYQLQEKVLLLLYESLCMSGFLALGKTETLLFSELRDKFEIIDKQERIYRKIA